MELQKSRHGFTLIELLVVIAIIAILAAILFPVFAQARAKARQASCTSNARQIGTATMMYKQDYDETYPYWSWWYSSDIGGGPRGDRPAAYKQFGSVWFNCIYPYVKNSGLYACGQTNDDSTLRQNLVWGWTNFIDQVGIVPELRDKTVSYCVNEPLHRGDGCGNAACKDASVDRPAETLWVGDGNNGLSTGGYPNRNDPNDPAHHYIISRIAYPNAPADCWSNNATCGAAQNDIGDNRPDLSPNASIFDQQARHTGGAILTMCDGHAKWVRDTRVTWDLFNAGGNQ